MFNDELRGKNSLKISRFFCRLHLTSKSSRSFQCSLMYMRKNCLNRICECLTCHRERVIP